MGCVPCPNWMVACNFLYSFFHITSSYYIHTHHCPHGIVWACHLHHSFSFIIYKVSYQEALGSLLFVGRLHSNPHIRHHDNEASPPHQLWTLDPLSGMLSPLDPLSGMLSPLHHANCAAFLQCSNTDMITGVYSHIAHDREWLDCKWSALCFPRGTWLWALEAEFILFSMGQGPSTTKRGDEVINGCYLSLGRGNEQARAGTLLWPQLIIWILFEWYPCCMVQLVI
jgi:hypothetical protein